MKKSEQIAINEQVLTALEKLNNSNEEIINSKRLDSCTAWIKETENYYILQSYNTNVAFIEKATHTMYDVLRYVYGYTATSGKHIAKFRRYNLTGIKPWDYGKELTYRNV